MPVIYLLQRSLSHLEDAGNTVRITFFDFSSAFNTIHPSLFRVKLERAGASDQLTAWVTNYLTDRPHASKTKEMVIDFSRKPSSNIAHRGTSRDLDIERVRTYKYLGVHLNNKLDWTDNTGLALQEGGLLGTGGGCSERDKKRLNRLIKRASSVCGSPLDSIE
ncbi:hypothetical protein L3Q82_009740, partial [Scortum barcoo]